MSLESAWSLCCCQARPARGGSLVKTVAFLLLTMGFLPPLRADDARAPAEFEVTDTLQQPNPGPFCATITRIPGDRLLFRGGAFEPLVFRTKVRPTGTAPDDIVLPASHGRTYATFRSGFWDGARVRVYRPYNGRLRKVRDDRIAAGGYVAEGWVPVPEMRGRLVDPQGGSDTRGRRGDADTDEVLALLQQKRLRFEMAPAAWRPGRAYWFAVQAVAKDGQVSPPSEAAKVQLRGVLRTSRAGRNVLIAFKPPRVPPKGAPPPAPQGLQAHLDAGGLVTLTWQAVRADNLAGYRVLVSEVPPEKQRGFHMRLKGKAATPADYIRKGDLVFLSMTRNNFSRDRFVHGFRWHSGPFGRMASPIIREYSEDLPDADWRRVKHPGPLPAAFTDPGETCLRLDLKTGRPFAIGMYAYGSVRQHWYPVLQPGRQYVAEGWVRYRGNGPGVVRFRLTRHYDRPPSQGGVEPFTFEAADEWRRFRYVFSPGYVVKSGPVGRIEFSFQGGLPASRAAGGAAHAGVGP